MMKTALPQRPGFRALVPLFVFLGVYLLASVWVDDFYAVPITVAFIIASMVAVALTDGLSLPERIARFSEGAADKNILIMIWIFYFGRGFCAVGQSNGGDRCDGKSYVVAFARSFFIGGSFCGFLFYFSLGRYFGRHDCCLGSGSGRVGR